MYVKNSRSENILTDSAQGKCYFDKFQVIQLDFTGLARLAAEFSKQPGAKETYSFTSKMDCNH